MNTQYIILLRRKFVPLGATTSELSVGPFGSMLEAVEAKNKIMADWPDLYSGADVIELMDASEVTGPPVQV